MNSRCGNKTVFLVLRADRRNFPHREKNAAHNVLNSDRKIFHSERRFRSETFSFCFIYIVGEKVVRVAICVMQNEKSGAESLNEIGGKFGCWVNRR